MLVAGKKHGLPIERHMAVDGEHLVPRDGLNMNEVGCLLSHIGLWRKAAEGPMLIMEDDVVFCEDFGQEIRTPRKLPEDWDIIFLGISWPEIGPEVDGFSKVISCYGTFAYIVSAKAAKRLVEFTEQQPNLQADWYARELFRRGELKGYVMNPSLCVAQWNESSIAPRNEDQARRWGTLFKDSLVNHWAGTPEWINSV